LLDWVAICFLARSHSFVVQSSLPCSTPETAIIQRSRPQWLRACSSAASAPKDPRSAMSRIFLLTLDRKVICLICTSFRFAVTKKSLPAMHFQRMTNGTSNMVSDNCCLNACCRRNPKRATNVDEPPPSVQSRMIPTSKIWKHVYLSRLIDIPPSRLDSCIKHGQWGSRDYPVLSLIQTMTVTTTTVQRGKEGERPLCGHA
jgi:hypothetical protein